ncbi:hypothetical protein A680_04170 [Salmonella enterica subsp. enterica serovar Enteritidis str. 2010K-0286]|nr:hypothetical protein A680_04170 [Salmonella enterica subsp. enterica serovar Enteritidis str. 2010K-0286]
MFCSFIWCPVPAYVPISWVIQDNRFLFTLPCRSYSSDKNALSEKMSKFFFGDRNSCCRTHLCFRS